MNLQNNFTAFSKKFDSFKKPIKFFIGIPLTIISFYFIFSIILKSKDQVITHITHADILLLIVGMIFLFLFFFFKGVVWKKILHNLGYDTDLKKAIYYYSLAETKRYIPGNVFSFISRINSGEKLEVPSKVVFKSIGIEILLLVVSSLFVSIPGIVFCIQVYELYIIRTYTFQEPFFQYVNIIGFVCLFVGFIILFFTYHISKRYRKDIIRYLDTFLLSGLTWFLFGIGNYCIISSMGYLEPYFFLQYVSFFVLSWLIGYLSFVAPMGLGVREAVLTLGLSTMGGLPLVLASALSVIGRIILIVTELLFLFVTRIALTIPKQKNIKPSSLILALSLIFYNAYFIYFTTEKHLNFFTGRFDLGNMDQTVWNTLHGRFFMLTNPDSTNIVSRLGTHADFILVLLSPFYLLWQDPRMLLIIQTIVLSIGAIYVYRFSQHVLKNENLSLVFAISYLLSPLVQRINLYDFHAVTLATTFLLASFYYLVKRQHIAFLVFLILSVLTKENVYLIGALFGIYCFITKRKLMGIFLLVSGITLFYLMVSKFIPAARGGEHFALSYFGDYGDSTISVAKNILLKPYLTFPIIFSASTFQYMIQLFVTTGFTSLFSPLYMFFVSPDIAGNLLSKNTNLRSINFQYTATLIPFIYISSIYGVKRLLQWKIPYVTAKNISYYILFFSIVASWSYGVLPGSKFPSLEVFNDKTPHRVEINAYLQHIPRRLSVASSNNIGAHLSHRENIYTIPNGMDQADVVAFLLTDEFAQPSLKEQRKMVKSLENDPRYRVIVRENDFVVFRRINSSLLYTR